MATSPILDDKNSSNNNHLDALGAITFSTSSKSPTPPASSPKQPKHQSLINTAESTKVADTSQGSGQAPAETQGCINSLTNFQESNIKLKRCKHGRIKIKDLSKKKLGQHSDNETNNARDPTNESNNNHVAGHNQFLNDMSVDKEVASGDPTAVDNLLNERPSKGCQDAISRLPVQPTTSLDAFRPQTFLTETMEDVKKSALEELKPNMVSKQSEIEPRINNRNRSRSRSRTPVKTSDKRESPIRASRHSRSPLSRDRSLSRERTRSSRRRNDDPSPKRRDRSRSRKRGRITPPRRRTPERHKYSGSYRHRRRSRRSRSSSRGSPRSHSKSPMHRELNYRYHRRDISRSPSKEKATYDRSVNELDCKIKDDLFAKNSHRRSPKRSQKELQAATLSSMEVDHVIVSQNLHVNHSSKSEPTLQTSSKPTTSGISIATQPRTMQQTTGPNFLPKLAQADPDPREAMSARSPTTPSNEDSVASDIYDPEEPVLQISPVDSPPIVEKNGEDDVPSSAVQLNQHEKYLQKFHRQERVVEEVKIALRPFYQNRTINKEQYKDVLRKAVPKICHSKNGEISPVKIRSLVDAYVKKMR